MTWNSWAGVGGGVLIRVTGVTRNICCVPPKPERMFSKCSIPNRKHMEAETSIRCALTYNHNHLFSWEIKRILWTGWLRSEWGSEKAQLGVTLKKYAYFNLTQRIPVLLLSCFSSRSSGQKCAQASQVCVFYMSIKPLPETRLRLGWTFFRALSGS